MYFWNSFVKTCHSFCFLLFPFLSISLFVCLFSPVCSLFLLFTYFLWTSSCQNRLLLSLCLFLVFSTPCFDPLVLILFFWEIIIVVSVKKKLFSFIPLSCSLFLGPHTKKLLSFVVRLVFLFCFSTWTTNYLLHLLYLIIFSLFELFRHVFHFFVFLFLFFLIANFSFWVDMFLSLCFSWFLTLLQFF